MFLQHPHQTVIGLWELFEYINFSVPKWIFFKKVAISILFMPLYLELNFEIYIFSLCFLNKMLLLCNFSTIVIFMSLWLWPLLLKCSHVTLLFCLFFTYPRCSENLSWSVLWVSPIYWAWLNLSVTSRPDRKLKFGTVIHKTTRPSLTLLT